jgi:hypothetical protein
VSWARAVTVNEWGLMVWNPFTTWCSRAAGTAGVASVGVTCLVDKISLIEAYVSAALISPSTKIMKDLIAEVTMQPSLLA